MALHIVRRLHGDEVARRTARDMEYDGVMGDRVLG
jgi:transcriptional regulator GlxA family with amidase domain